MARLPLRVARISSNGNLVRAVYSDMLIRLSLGVLVVLLAAAALSAVDYDLPPISYSSTPVDDPVARLAGRLARGEARLAWDTDHGWLPSLLSELRIPVSSQVLVFSKTSLQRQHIAPDAPRALYFNDEVYVGTVQGGAVLEIAATDPRQGTVFYVLPQKRGASSTLTRQTHECLQCHDSNSFTGGVPGLVMRSVYPDASGQPIFTAGGFVTDHRTRWEDRWGGWYVTGTYGTMRHLGNQSFAEGIDPTQVDRTPGANLTALTGRFAEDAYLGHGSDVVALMVLGHQVQMHNLLTRASYDTRLALRDAEVMNQALGRPLGERSESVQRRISSAAEALLRHLLFVGEPRLSGPVAGNPAYARDFTAVGPRDGQGRSLRDLDLGRRLLRHPCSWLIHSEAFDALPAEVRELTLERLRQVLTGEDQTPEFSHLDAADRRAIGELLVATKPLLPLGFRAAFTR